MARIPPAYRLVAEQRIVCNGTAKYSLNSTIRTGAALLIFTVETSDVRLSFGANSTVPSKTTGLLMVKNYAYTLAHSKSSPLKFSAANSTAGVVNIAGMRYAGSVAP